MSLPELKIKINRSSSQNDIINQNSYNFSDEENSIENFETKNELITLPSLPEINIEPKLNSVNSLINLDLKRRFKYTSLKKKQPNFPYDAEYASADYQIVKSRPSIAGDD